MVTNAVSSNDKLPTHCLICHATCIILLGVTDLFTDKFCTDTPSAQNGQVLQQSGCQHTVDGWLVPDCNNEYESISVWPPPLIAAGSLGRRGSY